MMCFARIVLLLDVSRRFLFFLWGGGGMLHGAPRFFKGSVASILDVLFIKVVCIWDPWGWQPAHHRWLRLYIDTLT